MEYWKIARPGHIFWQVDGPHRDKLEMSGQGCSLQMEYGVDADGRLFLEADCVYPGLRTRPNDTHASLIWHLGPEELHFLRVDGEILRETPERFDFDGILAVSGRQGDLKVIRKLFPSRKDRYVLERVTVEYTGARPVRLELLSWEKRYTKGAQGYYEQYPVVDACPENLLPGESVTVTVCFTAQNPAQPCRVLSGDREETLRRAFCAQVAGELA